MNDLILDPDNESEIDDDEAPGADDANRKPRGAFPKVAGPEAPAQRRERYEEWLISDGRRNPEYTAVMAQPDRNPKNEQLSLRLIVRARCYQCENGGSDAGYKERIAACDVRRCALWSVRPYKQPGEKPEALIPIEQVAYGDHHGQALAQPGMRRQAINGYCHDCQGGKRELNTMRAVHDCATSDCALWLARPLLKERKRKAGDEAAAEGAGDAGQTPAEASTEP